MLSRSMPPASRVDQGVSSRVTLGFVCVLLTLGWSGSVAPREDDAISNWAAGTRGGRVETLVNANSAHLMIDGQEGVPGRGWSFQGRLDAAWALFVLGSSATHEPGLGSQGSSSTADEAQFVRIVTGGNGNSDQHVSALRLWATDAPDPSLPAEWYDDTRMVIPALRGWRQIVPYNVSASLDGGGERSTAVYNSRVYLGGTPATVPTHVELHFEPMTATAVLLKVDAVVNEEHRNSRDKSHLPDSTDGIISEVQVFSSRVATSSQVRDPAKEMLSSVRGVGDETYLQSAVEWGRSGEDVIQGLDFRSALNAFNAAAWSGIKDDVKVTSTCDPHAEWRSSEATAVGGASASSATRPLEESWQEGKRDIEGLCDELAGLELLWVGDSRMRHAFLATLAYFRRTGFVRGFANRHRAVRHGGFEQRSRSKDGGGREHEEARQDMGACSAAYVPFEMELPCAGASPWSFAVHERRLSSAVEPRGWEAGVCGGRAVVRLLEGSDPSRLAARLREVVEDRVACEFNRSHVPAGSMRCYVATLVLASAPIPSLASLDLRQQRRPRLPPDFMQMSLRFVREVAQVGSLLATRGAASSEPREWGRLQVSGGQRGIALLFCTMEPVSSISADHAEVNSAIAQLNARTLGMLRSPDSGALTLPILDTHELLFTRSACSPDGIHWAGIAQRPRVRLVLALGSRIRRHIHQQKIADLTPAAYAAYARVGVDVGIGVGVDGADGSRAAANAAEADEVRRLEGARTRAVPPHPGVPGGAQEVSGQRAQGEDDGVRWSCEQIKEVPGRGQDSGQTGEEGRVVEDVSERWAEGACRAFVVPACSKLTGEELGFWRAEEDGTYTWHLETCMLRRFPAASTSEAARACLRNRHVLMVGDSVSRYQYVALAALLHHDAPERRGDVDGSSNLVMPGLVWGSWRRFYLESSARFGGRELCDCFRPEGPWSPEFEMRVEENRFFSLPAWNLSLSYLQVFGGFPMHGHLPGLCRGRSGLTVGVDGSVCSIANLSKASLMAAAHVLTPEEYDSNPVLDTHDFFDWHGDLATVLEHVVSSMEVDTLVLNSGLWGELTDADHVDGIFEAASRALGQHGTQGVQQGDETGQGQKRLLWKRTTKRFVCEAGHRRCHRSRWAPQFVGDKVPLEAAKRYGWGVLDVASPTAALEQDAFADGIHPRPFVYQELNNLLLNSICND